MIIKLLLFIKHRLKFVWQIIEQWNGVLFGFMYGKKMKSTMGTLFSKSYHDKYVYRTIEQKDLTALHDFFNKQDPKQYIFFKPHEFDLTTLRRLHRNPAFPMMGVFDGQKVIGYFFLRCFINKKCFIGRMVDKDYQRQGIARYMSDIMYQLAWRNNFKCLTTISKSNTAIMDLHKTENTLSILKELPNDYLLVEIKEPAKTTAPAGL